MIVLVLTVLALASSVFSQAEVVQPTEVQEVVATESSDSGGATSSTSTMAVPESVPLGSPKILKAYALTLVGKISVQVYGDSVSGENYLWVDYPHTDADPDKMAKVANAQKLRFSATTDGKLTSYISYESRSIVLTDPDNVDNQSSTTFTLFWGYKNFKLVKVENSWKVPETAKDIELELISQVPFVIPGMRDVYMITRDSEGNQNGYFNFRDDQGDYWLRRGIIFLNENLTSRNGELNVTMTDGSRATYDLASGDRKPLVPVEVGGFRPSIKNVRSVPENTPQIVYQEGDEIIRTAYTELMWTSIFFPSDLKRYPTKVCMIYTSILAENPNAKWIEFNPYTEPVRFKVQVGQAILIRFEYPEVRPPLWSNGGKG